ncbi:arsenate-mycothiol transferase ArsC [Gulosibacter molinativorax]|uniref:Low molecular weight phosphatase family protein n=1 Tax=Gulosibacter molinativorax TaxID=256821 RepID=A0ABT7C7Y4_9MICO|nr:low molecular weight phosphatase family protein [Gulosibacter molinativorax]MDJ1370771.1 low molecular weight phosphatase family protein [Gulosibacter molinativorax]QUY63202.1 Arsenate-mycothiol transferase ArsC1 [Gulosibacter molinativorax]
MSTPKLLFVCVKNGGKSQMAAALMRQRVGDAAEIRSAGTEPGAALNAQSVESLVAVGASTEGEYPKPITEADLRDSDLVIVLGEEAQLPEGAANVERWITDEPSLRGIEGAQRMDLVRDDIAKRVDELATRLGL